LQLYHAHLRYCTIFTPTRFFNKVVFVPRIKCHFIAVANCGHL